MKIESRPRWVATTIGAIGLAIITGTIAVALATGVTLVLYGGLPASQTVWGLYLISFGVWAAITFMYLIEPEFK